MLVRDVSIALSACRSLVGPSRITPSLITALQATPPTAAHRHGHEKHHEHDRYRNHDHDDSRPYGRNGGQQGVAPFVFLQSSDQDVYPDAAPRRERWEPNRQLRRHGGRQ